MAKKRKPQFCRDCNAKFARSSQLRRHEAIIEEPRSLKCTECNKTFGSLDCLANHSFLHGKKYADRVRSSKKRNQRQPVDRYRKYPDSVEFGIVSQSPDNDSDLTTRIKTALGPCSSSFEKSRDVEDFVDTNAKRLGVQWKDRSDGSSNGREVTSSPPSEMKVLVGLFNSVKKVNSLQTDLASLRMSPLPENPF